MEFWGITIPPGKTVKVNAEGRITHVSNATLICSGKKKKPNAEQQHLVRCKIGSDSKSFVVCALRERIGENAPLALVLPDEEFEFSGSATHQVSLVGHTIPEQEFGMEEEVEGSEKVKVNGAVADREDDDDEEGEEAEADDDEDDEEEEGEEEEEVDADEDESEYEEMKADAEDEEEDEEEDDDEEDDEEPEQKSKKRKEAPSSESQGKPKIVKLSSGLKFRDIRVGKGPKAKKGKTLSVRYRGLLKNGIEFDSNMPKGRPFSFVLGAGEVVKGWDLGLAGMTVGSRRELVIPPHLGYGQRGAGSKIPGNATLLFDVELLKVK